MNLLKITHSYKPCGTKISYLEGMQAPTLKDLTVQMKQAAFQASIQEQPKKSKLIKVA